MLGDTLILMVISAALLPFNRAYYKSKTRRFFLALIAICYIGLVSLAINVENVVTLRDKYPGRTVTGWSGDDWLYAAVLDVALITIAHIVMAISGPRNKPFRRVPSAVQVEKL